MSKNSVKTILITLYLSAVQDPEPLFISFDGIQNQSKLLILKDTTGQWPPTELFSHNLDHFNYNDCQNDITTTITATTTTTTVHRSSSGISKISPITNPFTQSSLHVYIRSNRPGQFYILSPITKGKKIFSWRKGGSWPDWLIMVRLRMDLWVGRRRGVCVGAFRIFGDKIPAFTWMDGGSPSEGGFYAVEFPTPKDIRRSLLWGCGSASFTVLPKLESNITDAFKNISFHNSQFSHREKKCIFSGNAKIRVRALSQWFGPFFTR